MVNQFDTSVKNKFEYLLKNARMKLNSEDSTMARPAQFKREEVVEKAMRAFWDHGYGATSLADLVEVTDRILAETGFDPKNLAIEITESAYLEDPDSLTEVMRALKERGIHLHVDDFGVGYSSLSYLRRFPIDAVKIDRSFISRVDQAESSESLEIVRAVVALAKSLKLDVVAEGVEREEQKQYLETLECPYAQGFLFAKPLDPESAKAFLMANLKVTQPV